MTPFLPASKAVDLIEASTHAHAIGRPLNLSVTIHFEAGNLKPHYRPQDAIHYWLKPAGQWLGLRGIPMTYIWIIEHAVGTGEHVHIMLHIPPEHRQAFIKKGKTSWLKKAGMKNDNPDTLLAQKIGPRSYRPGTANKRDKQTYLNQLKGFLRYHLKAVDPDEAIPSVTGDQTPFAQVFRIEPEYSHPIHGRRASQSQNIGRTARERYHATKTVED